MELSSLPSTEYEAGTPDAPEGFPNLLELFHEEMDEADGVKGHADITKVSTDGLAHGANGSCDEALAEGCTL